MKKTSIFLVILCIGASLYYLSYYESNPMMRAMKAFNTKYEKYLKKTGSVDIRIGFGGYLRAYSMESYGLTL